MSEEKQDITEILAYKADIAVDQYKPLVNIRQILLEAKEEIESLRASVEAQRAEILRLSQVAKY